MSEIQHGRFIETASPDVPAAAKLLEYIRENEGTIPRFAEVHGLDRVKVQKAINGTLKRVDVAFAIACRRATGGAVAVEDWVLDSEPDSPRGAA